MYAFTKENDKHRLDYNQLKSIFFSFIVFSYLVCTLIFFYKASFLPVVQKHWGLIRGWDGSHYYFWARSLLFDHDINFKNDLLFYNNLPLTDRQTLLSQTLTQAGLYPNKYSIGWSIFTIPAFGLGYIFLILFKIIGHQYQADGYTFPFQLSIGITHLFYGYLSIFLLYKTLVTKTENKNIAIASAVLAWMASPLTFYQTADLTMSHNVTFLSLISLFYYTQKIENSNNINNRGFLLIGIISSLLILCRPQACIYLLYPLTIIFKSPGRKIYKTFYFFLPLIIFGAIQFILYYQLNGTLTLYSYKGETFNFSAPNLFLYLFDSFHGAFYWHPLLLLSIITTPWVLKKENDKTLITCLIISVFINIYINASWHSWWFGASFGQRALEGTLILQAIALAYFIQSSNSFIRVYISSLCLILVVWNLNLTCLVIKGVLPLNQAVNYESMIKISKSYWVEKLR